MSKEDGSSKSQAPDWVSNILIEGGGISIAAWAAIPRVSTRLAPLIGTRLIVPLLGTELAAGPIGWIGAGITVTGLVAVNLLATRENYDKLKAAIGTVSHKPPNLSLQLSSRDSKQLAEYSPVPGSRETLISIPKDATSAQMKTMLKANLKAMGLSLDTIEKKLDGVIARLDEAKVLAINEALANAEKIKEQKAQESQDMISIGNAGAQGLCQLGEALRCPELQTLGRLLNIGVQSYEIYHAIEKVSALKKLDFTSVIGGLGVIGLVAGLLSAIFSLFGGGGPNPTQVILEQLGRLSQQLGDVHRDIKEGLFDIRREQARTLEILVNGLNLLQKDLREKVVGLRVEFAVAFRDLSEGLDYLSNLNISAAKNQYLQPLYQYCTQVHTVRLSEGAIARQLTKSLETWLITDARNEVLTGQIISKSLPAPRIHLQLLHTAFESELALNGLLSYLMPEKSMINPLAWHQAVSHYIMHTSRFFSFYMADEDKVLEETLRIGEEQQRIFADLAEDKPTWQALIDDYYSQLKNVLDCQNAYTTAFNHSRHEHFNSQYLQNRLYGEEKDANPTLPELQVLGSPANFIKQFEARSIQHVQLQDQKLGIVEDHKVGGALPEAQRRFDVPLQRLFTTLKALPAVPGERRKLALLLAAESLDPGTFIFSPKTTAITPPYVPLDKIFIMGINPTEQEIIHIVSNDESPGVNYLHDLNSQWRLPIDLVISGTEVVKCIFEGDYRQLPSIRGITNLSVQARYAYRDPGGDQGFHYKLCRAIPDYLRDQWSAGQGRCISVEIADNPEIKGTRVSERVNEIFLRERRQLVDDLHSCRSEGYRQALLINYEEALMALDIAVLKLKIFAHLVGKQWNGAVLLTSQFIKGEMKQQADHLDQIDLTPNLSAAVGLPKEKRIQVNSLKNEDDDKSISEYHPLSLLNETVRCLRSHLIWRQLTRVAHPELRYVNINYYRSDCNFLALERIREEVYDQLGELKGVVTGFTEARTDIYHPGREPMSPEDYKRIRRAISHWGLNHAIHRNATGYAEGASLKHAATDIQRLQRGWECNIAFLFQLASSWDALESMELVIDPRHLVNFKMWLDSSTCFLHLLDFPGGTYWAEQARYLPTHQIRVLRDMFSSGFQLHRAINLIASSPKLFEQLFNEYLIIIERLKTIVNQCQQGQPPASDTEVFNTLSGAEESQHTGAYAQVKNELEEKRCLIENYIRMAFNNEGFVADLDKIKSTHSLNPRKRDAFTQYLSAEEKSYKDIPLKKRLEDYIETIINFQRRVIQHSTYVRNLQFFAYCLENYFRDNWPCDTLMIAPGLCTPQKLAEDEKLIFSFDVDHIDLIDQFLTTYPHIRSVILCQIPLDDNLLASLVTCIRSHRSVVDLRLVAAQLQSHHLTLFTPLLQQLQVLELSANCLAAQGPDGLHFLIDFIRLAQTSSLRQLTLVSNELEGLGEAAIKAAIRSNPRSITSLLTITTTMPKQLQLLPVATAAKEAKLASPPVKFHAKVMLEIGQVQLQHVLSLLHNAYRHQSTLMQDPLAIESSTQQSSQMASSALVDGSLLTTASHRKHNKATKKENSASFR